MSRTDIASQNAAGDVVWITSCSSVFAAVQCAHCLWWQHGDRPPRTPACTRWQTRTGSGAQERFAYLDIIYFTLSEWSSKHQKTRNHSNIWTIFTDIQYFGYSFPDAHQPLDCRIWCWRLYFSVDTWQHCSCNFRLQVKPDLTRKLKR